MIEKLYREVDNFPKRIRRKEKNRFLDYITEKITNLGYEIKQTKGRYIFKSVNLETENDDADIILGAHYDTPTILPFFFEYLFKIFGHTRQFFMIFGLFLLYAGFKFIASEFPDYNWLFTTIKYLFWLSFITILIPNPNNRNDNTSGVVTLLAVAEKLSHYEHLKKRVKFVFFDNEELGLLGSFMQAKKWKKQQFPAKTKKFITVGCVGRGEVPVIIYHKKDTLAKNLHEIFIKKSQKARIIRLPFYPLSDNYILGSSGAVNISWMDKTVIPGGYYIRNIHSPKDKDVDYNKLEIVTNVLFELFKQGNGHEK